MSLDSFLSVKKSQTRTGINISCYVSVLEQYKAKYPTAMFEIVMRFPFGQNKIPSRLSPSQTLLTSFKEHRMDFQQFAHDFEQEIFLNRSAVNKLKILRDLAKRHEIFLVCCEKDPKYCHRRLLKEFIDRLDYYLRKWGRK